MNLADYGTSRAAAAREQSGARSDAFSGYSSGTIDTRGQFARTEQPEQLARRRWRPAPLT